MGTRGFRAWLTELVEQYSRKDAAVDNPRAAKTAQKTQLEIDALQVGSNS